MFSSLISWLKRNRTTVRLAFVMRITSMGLGSILGLIFPRLLVRAMGDDLYALLLTFSSVTRLGGLSDLGMSGAVALRTGQYLGEGEETKLKRLLASARSVILILAIVSFLAFIAVSPWLMTWLKFQKVENVGSLNILMILGAVNVAVVLVAGYFHSLNFALGTVTWPILPTVLISQILAPLVHVVLARHGAPFWVQYLPYVVAATVTGCLACMMVKWAHPWLGNLRPIEFDSQIWRNLTTTSGWVYLTSLGSTIYFATDRLLIFPGFGGLAVNQYTFNYKFCELSTAIILTASFVSIPKITQWMASKQETDRSRVLSEINLLNVFQIVFGCAAALAYLAINDAFVAIWQGSRFQVPLALQVAFACNLVVTTSGDAGIQVAGRCGTNGMRNTGIAVGLTGLLNLGLSYLSMRMGFLTGIAAATALAQTALSLSLGWATCRYLNISFARWSLKSCFLPLSVVGIAAGLRLLIKPDSVVHFLELSALYALLLICTVRLAGLDKAMIQKEFSLIKGLLGRR